MTKGKIKIHNGRRGVCIIIHLHVIQISLLSNFMTVLFVVKLMVWHIGHYFDPNYLACNALSLFSCI